MCSRILKKSGVSIGKLLVRAYLSEHDILIKRVSKWHCKTASINSVTIHPCNVLPVADCIIVKKLKGKTRKRKKIKFQNKKKKR